MVTRFLPWIKSESFFDSKGQCTDGSAVRDLILWLGRDSVGF